jgi:hypothetical protein
MARRLFAALALLLLAASPGRAGDDLVLGILEQLSPAQQQRLEREYRYVGSAVARVAFVKRDGRWQSLAGEAGDVTALAAASDHFPRRLDWTVAFDGRARGHLASANFSRWLAYADIGLQLIEGRKDAWRIGRPSADFAPWDADGPVYRPLVLVSQPNVGDPERWQPAPLPAGYVAAALPTLRAAMASEDGAPAFRNGDVGVFKAYRAASGKHLFALSLRPALFPSDEVPGPAASPHWFVAGSPGTTPRFLGSEMILIDAGDYDADGRSELLFMAAGYNRGGYRLFFDDLRQSVAFGWNYH